MTDQDFHEGRTRSPVYPFINLSETLRHLEPFFQQYRYSKVMAADALKGMGYSITSGSGSRILAAFNQFGLFNFEGIKDDRLVWLSDVAIDILKQDKNTLTAIQKAALKPEMHGWMWSYYQLAQKPLPSDSAVLSTLIRNKGFNEKAAFAFLKEFKETFEFAQLENYKEANEKPKNQTIGLQSIISKQQVGQPTTITEDATNETREFHIPLTRRQVARIQLPMNLKAKDFEILSNWFAVMKDAELYQDESYNEDET